MKEPERRGTVDQDEVVAFRNGGEGVGEHALATHLRRKLELGRGQVDRGRDQVGSRPMPHGGLVGGTLREQNFVDGLADVGPGALEADGEGGLRIEVHEQHTLPFLVESGAEVEYGCSLSDATFLVGDADDSGHILLIVLITNYSPDVKWRLKKRGSGKAKSPKRVRHREST